MGCRSIKKHWKWDFSLLTFTFTLPNLVATLAVVDVHKSVGLKYYFDTYHIHLVMGEWRDAHAQTYFIFEVINLPQSPLTRMKETNGLCCKLACHLMCLSKSVSGLFYIRFIDDSKQKHAKYMCFFVDNSLALWVISHQRFMKLPHRNLLKLIN